jgi:hypothetical protein
VRNKIIVGIVLLIAVFLVSFFPQFIKARRLDNELRDVKQQYAAAQLRDVIGLAYLQASQKNFGLAAETTARFFSLARDLSNQMADANSRKALADLLIPRDKITAQLAKGDAGALNDLQLLFLNTRQATVSSIGP